MDTNFFAVSAMLILAVVAAVPAANVIHAGDTPASTVPSGCKFLKFFIGVVTQIQRRMANFEWTRCGGLAACALSPKRGAHEYFRELPGPKISSEWSPAHSLLLTSPVSAALVLGWGAPVVP